MESYEEFEKHVHWLYELIERNNSEVTWNEKIPDPDNPKQGRQVDVVIRNKGKITIVECRSHNRPQDVVWIEGLIGRKGSLEVDAVIAVSSSGFTEGAILKAKKHGIILRDFLELTEQEISTWGRVTKVTINYFQYADVVLTLTFQHTDKNLLDKSAIPNDLGFGRNLFLLFEEVAKRCDDKLKCGQEVKLSVKKGLENWRLCGCEVLGAEMHATVKSIEEQVDVPIVKTYGSPIVSASKRRLKIEEIKLGQSKVAQLENELSMIIDFSGISPPPNAQFRTIQCDMGRVVNAKIEAIGVPELKVPVELIRLKVRFD